MMRPASISLKPVGMPAGGLLPPGWFALHPDQFDGEAAQTRAHGRWFRIASRHGAVFRALQLTPDLPRAGIALDWPAQHRLYGGPPDDGAAPLRLDIRSAHFYEYPRCLLGHPSPAARLGGGLMVLALLACTAALVIGIVAGSGIRQIAPTAGTEETVQAAEPLADDPAAFLGALAGDWRSDTEQLLIKNDKGVIEILRQTRLEDGQVRLDQYAVAPVRLDPAQRSLQLETPEGPWQLTLLPGTPRTQLSVTYADQRNVVYR